VNETTHPRKVAIIVSKGGMDEVFPALILANGARQSGIDALLFFTFYGLDAIIEKKVDHLHVNMAGNAAAPMPTIVAGLPGMESIAASMMKRKMANLDIPSVREMLQILDDSGAQIYGCELAMKMFEVDKKDLVAQVKDVITVGDFYDLSADAQIIFT
jgi:peroxiredoxin family protein